jgi:HEAT repeat protein
MTRLHLALALCLLADPARPAVRADDALDADMFREPELATARVVKTFPEGLTALWLTALDRPEADLQGRAALAVASAHERGLQGLAAAVPALLRALDRQNPGVRAAAARALVALDARDAAPSFLRHARDADADLREVVEPALARWGHRPAAALWLDRLGQASPPRRSLTLAVQGLASLREEAAVARLRDLVLSARESPPHRLEAANALAAIRATGWEDDAARLAADASPGGLTARLAAASLLRQHKGNRAVQLLQTFARDSEPAVAAAALIRLAELDSALVLPVLDPVLASPDGKVRLFGVEALSRHPSDRHVQLLGGRLADPHPDVRARARLALREAAGKAGLRGAVLAAGMGALAADDWRAREQAALLLAQLGHKPGAARLVELLTSDRAEVLVAAARGLRALAVPETLPAALAYLDRRHRDPRPSGKTAGLGAVPAEALDRQLSQLVQLLGRARYRPAERTLVALVPRFGEGNFTPAGGETRAAAIWALGLFHEGDPDADLVGLIEGRLTGDPGMGPDDRRVRRMSAVSLGRMKAREALPSLELISRDDKPTTDLVVVACRWAIAQVAGRPMPPPGVIEAVQRDWFLTPVR